MEETEELVVRTKEQYERLLLEVVGLRDLEPMFGSPQYDRLQEVEQALAQYQSQFAPTAH